MKYYRYGDSVIAVHDDELIQTAYKVGSAARHFAPLPKRYRKLASQLYS